MAFINSGYNHIPFSKSGYTSGSNGLSGFKTFECYMIVKYGKPGDWNVGGESEYLLELPLYPDEVQEQISASWATQPVLGRSAPLVAYAQTDLKSVSFSLDLHRDLITGSYSLTESDLQAIGGNLKNNQMPGHQVQSAKGPFDTRTWYTNANKMLQICCYPQYTNSGLIPPTTYFVFGQMILKGYVEHYSTVWKKPILNTFYGWNTVNISMYCYPDSVISANDIITGPGAASTQNTYNTTFPGKSETANVMARTETRERSNLRTQNTLGGSVSESIIET